MDTHRGTFTGAHELLDRLRARQAEIGLSNAELDDICGWPGGGVVDKYLGPSRVKWPGMDVIFRMMYALGLSGELVVDDAKVARMTPIWRASGKRKIAAIRNENPRVSKAMLQRAAPAVAAQMGRKGAEKRWKGTTAADLDAHCAMMRQIKEQKALSRLR
jgi:hypothetical protein